MSGDPVLLIASHPTRGVDVGAQAQIWGHIKKARKEGLAVLLISADLDELIGLSDTSGCCCAAASSARSTRRPSRPQELGSAMTGAGDARVNLVKRIALGARRARARPGGGRRSSPACAARHR